MKINQALFGYSNGHHLLKSSVTLSNISLKKLEPLSDLSGSEMQSGFEEYITGCPLPEDQYYAISKTWYATEMKRPGCVWTHTLLLDFAALKGLSQYTNIDNIFSKPMMQNDLFLEQYSQQLYIEESKFTPNNNENLNVKNYIYNEFSFLIHILCPFFESMEPIIIAADSSVQYNSALEFLLLRTGRYFFKPISFCTGSLSNRILDRKPLDIQVVPAGLSRNIYRINPKFQMISGSKKDSCPQWMDLIIKNFVTQEESEFKNFVLEFGDKYIERKYLKAFAEIYIIKTNNCESTGVQYLNTIVDIFESCEQSYIVNKAFSLLFCDKKISTYLSGKSFSNILLNFSLSKQANNWVKMITETELNHVVEIILKEYTIEAKNLFKNLISNDINKFGESIIFAIASLITPNNLHQLTDGNGYESNILIKFNWELALSSYLWKQSLNSQIETLECLSNAYKNSDIALKNQFKSMIQVIFSMSLEDLSDQVYNAFGSLAVKTFFEWGEYIEKDSQLNQWAKLCNHNIDISTQLLVYTQNSKLFQSIISVLDAYDKAILSTNKDVWIDLYHRFCVNDCSQELSENFAQFILPLIIKSEDLYPTDIAYFAFKNVHDMLARDQINHNSWERLSKMLPEVAWNNNWDRCKRLRKAIKKKQYDFDIADRNNNKNN